MEDNGKGLLGASGRDKELQYLPFYKFIIDSLPVAVITVSSELKITSFNPTAEELTGYSVKEAMGHYCGDILQGGMCRVNCPLKTVINRRNPIVRLETTIQNKRGDTVPVRMNTAALLEDDGKLIGGVEAFQDISHIKALEREKANLTSMIAHDMKSSLAIIGGFVLRVLKKKSHVDEEKQEKYLEIIRKEEGKLESLIDEFLEFSHLQTGALRLNFSTTSLDRELLELVEVYQPNALQNGIHLELELKEALPIIEADTNRLHRVFANILGNALKFSKEKSKVTITTHVTDLDVIIKFIDQGPGIDPRDIPYIFEPFHRGQNQKKSEGYGLGLAAVKAIVEGHGGRVFVESKLGKGSIFTVVLPKERKTEEIKRKL
jgi:PAS domain S-box-containing protein